MKQFVCSELLAKIVSHQPYKIARVQLRNCGLCQDTTVIYLWCTRILILAIHIRFLVEILLPSGSGSQTQMQCTLLHNGLEYYLLFVGRFCWDIYRQLPFTKRQESFSGKSSIVKGYKSTVTSYKMFDLPSEWKRKCFIMQFCYAKTGEVLVINGIHFFSILI